MPALAAVFAAFTWRRRTGALPKKIEKSKIVCDV